MSADELRDLVDAYDAPREGGGVELLDRMDALGGVAAAGELASASDAADRLLAARLMHLLPDETHLGVLEQLVLDGDRDVARAARRALRTQRRTPAWHTSVDRLADQAPDGSLRAELASWR